MIDREIDNLPSPYYLLLCQPLSLHKRTQSHFAFFPSFSTINFWVWESGGDISIQLPAIVPEYFSAHSEAFILNKSLMCPHTLMNVDLAGEKKKKNLIKNVENANVVDSNSFQKELSPYKVNYL